MTENEITGDILDASTVYETLLEIELKKRGHKVERQKSISFEYEGVVLENAFRLDMLVDDTVIVELKSTEKMSPVFAKQLKTYLAITKLQVGVVVNFGMSTLKEGFLRFVNNFTEPQLQPYRNLNRQYVLLKKGEGNSKVEEGKVVSPRKIAPTPSVFGAGVEECEMARKGARGCVRPCAAEGFFWAGEGEVAR